MRKKVFNQLLIFAFGLAVLASSALGQQGRYLAVLGDGRRISGDKLTGWYSVGGTVRLENTVVLERDRGLLWMRDSKLRPWPSANEHQSSGYIEFVGGDRIVGQIAGGQSEVHDDGVYVPAHILVRPASTKRLWTHGDSVEYVRVLPESIRRVVFRRDVRHRFQPGTVFYNDGRRVGFVRLRWREGSVLFLLKAGTRTVNFSDIAEIHMPQTDSWQWYYRELAVLAPGGRSRLIRIETTDGLIATGSEARFGARRFASDLVLLQANERRRQYDREIARLKTSELNYRERLDKYRADYNRQVAAIEAGIKKDELAYSKALAEWKSRGEKELKDDTAKLAQRRKKLQESFRKAVEDIEKRLSRLPEDKRKSQRKTSIDSKSKALDSALKLIDKEVQKAELRRQASLAKIEKDRATKLTYIAQARGKLPSAMALVTAAAERRGQYSGQLESYKAKRDALPGPEGSPDTWLHMVQPAWSLEPLWVPFNTIRMQWLFSADKVPLSRMQPTETVSPPMLQWRADRNSRGGLLRSGGRLHGWGFGVHAYSELTFALPPAAASFQSRLGLDHLAETGGCVRGKVYLGSTKTKPVYQSAMLIGPKKTADTGAIRIPASPKGPIDLILQVDPVSRNHPPQADPLNIRDIFDWLEPQLAFDAGRLRGEIGRYVGSLVGAWHGWTVTFDKRGVYTWGSWLDWAAKGERGLFLPTIRAKAQPLKLSKEMTIPADHKWLVVRVGFPDGGDLQPNVITLRIGEEEIQPEKIPIKQYWRRRTPPLVYSIEKYRGRKIKLELAQRPDDKELYWRGIGTLKDLPEDYRLVRALVAAGKKDMKLPRGLGLTLQWSRLRKAEVLEALEVTRLGGYVTFCNEVTGQLRYEYLYGVMIGNDWTGGDATFAKLKDMRWVRLLLISKDSGVSAGAIAKLQAAKGEEFVVRQVDRTPSAWGGMSCTLTIRNRRDKDVMVFQIHGWGGFTDTRQIKPGGEVKMHAHEGFRYEAHSVSKDYNKSKPISRCVVKGDTVWEIK